MISNKFREVFSINDRVFGLDCNGLWCSLLSNGRLAYPDDFRNGVLYLICLEKSIVDLKKDLDNLVEKNNFPYEFIIHGGLASSSDYWVEKAIAWLSDIDDEFEKSDEIKEQLQLIMDSKTHNQNVRHKAKKAYHNLKCR